MYMWACLCRVSAAQWTQVMFYRTKSTHPAKQGAWACAYPFDIFQFSIFWRFCLLFALSSFLIMRNSYWKGSSKLSWAHCAKPDFPKPRSEGDYKGLHTKSHLILFCLGGAWGEIHPLHTWCRSETQTTYVHTKYVALAFPSTAASFKGEQKTMGEVRGWKYDFGQTRTSPRSQNSCTPTLSQPHWPKHKQIQ